MQNFWKTFWLTAVVIVMIGNTTIFAAEPNTNPAEVDGKLSLGRCIQKGNLDFVLFLNTLIYNDGFTEGMLEPWNDVLIRNQCHSSDVINLIKQQDKIRAAIRDAFLTCRTEKLPTLKRAHHELTIEIYYVRHIVDTTLVSKMPADALNNEEFKASATKQSTAFYNELKTKYVKNDFITQKDFDLLFDKLESKYQDKKDTYIVCEKSSWKEVSDKWTEFKEFFEGEFSGGGNSGKATFAPAKKIETLVTEDSFSDYASGLVQVNLNNLDINTGAEFLKNDLEKTLPTNVTPTQLDLLGAIVNADRNLEVGTLEKEMSAKFESLYLNANDASIELFLNNLDGRTVKSTDGLLEIIDNSFPAMKKVLDGAKKMNSRQCPG